MPQDDLIKVTSRGLYCAAGDFYIDPWQPVARALITHAHGDHLRSGSADYYLASAGAGLARVRLPLDASIHPLGYGHCTTFGKTQVSLHPAGHVLGSSQIIAARLEWLTTTAIHHRSIDAKVRRRICTSSLDLGVAERGLCALKSTEG